MDARQWYLFDDSRCSPVDPEDVITKSAYVLCYINPAFKLDKDFTSLETGDVAVDEKELKKWPHSCRFM